MNRRQVKINIRICCLVTCARGCGTYTCEGYLYVVPVILVPIFPAGHTSVHWSNVPKAVGGEIRVIGCDWLASGL